MADTPTTHYGYILQQPGTNRNTWGGKLNMNWSELDTDLFAVSTVANAASALATGALQKAGDTATGDIVLADVGPTAAASAGFRAAPVVNFDAAKTLALSEAGKTIRLTGTTARTLTIPPVGSVGFPVGTAIVLRNVSTQNLTIARGSGVTLTLAGSSTNKNCVLAPRGLATLLHEESNVWVLSGAGAS